uniref:CSON013997 protein n=1 Tax=Culicoides sonorensis TaxID=179676 RepID=A0A336MC77_CULSO
MKLFNLQFLIILLVFVFGVYGRVGPNPNAERKKPCTYITGFYNDCRGRGLIQRKYWVVRYYSNYCYEVTYKACPEEPLHETEQECKKHCLKQ